MNSISFFKALLMKELEEKDLPGNQEKIAQAAEPKDKITAADFKALRAKKGMKKEMDHSDAADKKIDASEKAFLQKIYKDVPVEKVPEKHRWALEMKEGEDHEVSMASNSLESIIKSAIELKAKMGDQEKDIPAWIQDHITNAENYINQASKNYHEYHNGEHDMDELPDGTIEEPATMQERREYDQKAMEKLGFNFYPGGRSEAWEFATQELGISPDEILGKMSDDDVYNAIDSSLNILGYYNDEDEDLNETSLSSMLDNLLEAKKKPSAGLSKKQKSAIVKKAKSGKDMGKRGKGFEKIVKAAKKSGADNPEAVAGAAFWKGQAKKEGLQEFGPSIANVSKGRFKLEDLINWFDQKRQNKELKYGFKSQYREFISRLKGHAKYENGYVPANYVYHAIGDYVLIYPSNASAKEMNAITKIQNAHGKELYSAIRNELTAYDRKGNEINLV